jgi:exopolysaccharide biosynthesis protein
MKKTSGSICVYLWTIFLCLPISAQDFRAVQDGIEYAEIKRTIDKKPVKINLLRLDLTKVRLDVVHALDSAIGTETTSSMAMRYGAFAAINAGFFRLDKSIFAGDATGVLAINNDLYSESYGGRVALMIDNNLDRTQVSIERANISDFIEVNDKTFDVGRNRERKDNDLVLFSNNFNYTTLTDNNGIEFFIENKRVVKIVDQKGSNKIPSDGYILSASGKTREELKTILKLGTRIIHFVKQSSPTDSTTGTLFGIAEDIIGGVPQLIENGKIEITWKQEKQSKEFVETRHPRTAVAKLKDGKFLMITVNGRSAESVGINLLELAQMLLKFGAMDAMNLDGGGSTTMFLDGKVVNQPSDKEGERKVGDAILVFPRKIK